MIKKYFALSVIAASVVVAGCSSDDNDDEVVVPVNPVVVATPGVGGTAFDTIVNSDDHTSLEAAIIAAGLADALDNPANTFTIFAPNDAAFMELDNDGDDATPTTAELLEPANMAALVRVLQYHVISGDVSSTDVTDLISAAGTEPAVQATLLADAGVAQSLTFTLSDSANSGVAVNGVDIDAVDQIAAEGALGRVHVISSLLMPAAAPVETGDGGDTGADTAGGGDDSGMGNGTGGTPVPAGAVDTTLSNLGTSEIFRTAINNDFAGSLDAQAWTVFVPSDAVLDTAGVTALTASQQQDHIVSAGANDPATLAGLTTIRSSSNVDYAVATSAGVTTVGGFPVELIATGAGGAQVYSIGGVLAP